MTKKLKNMRATDIEKLFNTRGITTSIDSGRNHVNHIMKSYNLQRSASKQSILFKKKYRRSHQVKNVLNYKSPRHEIVTNGFLASNDRWIKHGLSNTGFSYIP